uniref:SAP domain-containing protein n=1 Tax=Fusobacterium nucleatum TaxID=851 RepID=UPI0035640AB5
MFFMILLVGAVLCFFIFSKKGVAGKENQKNACDFIIKTEKEIPKFSYVGQTVFLDWVDGKSIKEKEDYPQYFFYDYGILNCKELHKNMIRENFLQEANIKIILLSKSVDELKKILEEYGLKKSGKKIELVERIIENNDFSKIDVSNSIYELSEKGKEFIKKYNYILVLRGTSISVSEFEKEKAKIEKPLSTNDIIWSIYNKHSLSFFYAKDFGLYRNTIFEMANFLRKEGRNKQALLFELKGLYCDLSGKSNNNSTEPKEMLFIVNASNIFKLKDYFSSEMLDSCWQVEFPFHYCNKRIFSDIVSDIFNGLSGNEILEKYKTKMKATPKEAMLIDLED